MIEAESRLVNEQRDLGEREVILTSLHVAQDWPTDPPAAAWWYMTSLRLSELLSVGEIT